MHGSNYTMVSRHNNEPATLFHILHDCYIDTVHAQKINTPRHHVPIAMAYNETD